MEGKRPVDLSDIMQETTFHMPCGGQDTCSLMDPVDIMYVDFEKAFDKVPH